MVSLNNFRFSFSIALAALGAVGALAALGAEPPAPAAPADSLAPMPKTLTFRANVMRDGGNRGFKPRQGLGGTDGGIPGFRPRQGLRGSCGEPIEPYSGPQTTWLTVSGDVYDAQGNGSKYAFLIWLAKRGDLLPVSRAVYRVGAMTPGGGEQLSTAAVEMERVDDPPTGVGVTEGALAFPFNRPEMYPDSNAWSTFRDREFFASYYSAGGKPAVRVVVKEPARVDQQDVHVKGVPHVLRVGDVLRLDDYRHRVVNLVPPNPETGVIGWFELQLEPEAAGDEQK